MTSTLQTPIAAEIGEDAVVRIETLRARGQSARQIAATLGLDVYAVDEVFAWHDLLCGLSRGAARPYRTGPARRPIGRHARVAKDREQTWT